jgi:hypothetical protein
MKNDPVFKFVAAAIFAAVCTAFYSATHFKTQELYSNAIAVPPSASADRVAKALRHPERSEGSTPSSRALSGIVDPSLRSG